MVCLISKRRDIFNRMFASTHSRLHKYSSSWFSERCPMRIGLVFIRKREILVSVVLRYF